MVLGAALALISDCREEKRRERRYPGRARQNLEYDRWKELLRYIGQ